MYIYLSEFLQTSVVCVITSMKLKKQNGTSTAGTPTPQLTSSHYFLLQGKPLSSFSYCIYVLVMYSKMVYNSMGFETCMEFCNHPRSQEYKSSIIPKISLILASV